MAGVHQADDLTIIDEAGPDWRVQDSISGKAKTVIQSSAGHVGISISDSILGLFLVFRSPLFHFFIAQFLLLILNIVKAFLYQVLVFENIVCLTFFTQFLITILKRDNWTTATMNPTK